MGSKKNGVGQPKPQPRVRTSRKADLAIANGQDLSPENGHGKESDPSEQESNVQDGNDAVIGVDNNDTEMSVAEHLADVEQPVIVAEEEQPSSKPEIIAEEEPAAPLKRVFVVDVTVDQRGLRFKNGERAGELVDPHNNILKSINYTAEGECVNIAHAAGRIANELSAFYQNLAGKGIHRSVGFNVNLRIVDTVNGEKRFEQMTIVEQLRMTNPIDVAFACGDAILRQVEGENAESLLTGDFRITTDGRMFLGKLRMNKDTLNLPLTEIRKLVDIRRKSIKANVRTNVNNAKESMGIVKVTK